MAKKPNIVVILVDDMGYGDFSRFNEGRSSTPVLDEFIDESVCFSHQYTASPVCNPSRAALLTGRYPHRTGSLDTLEWRGLERLGLWETTLADILKHEGYTTGLVGKWHLGSYGDRYHPTKRGFDEAVCFRGGMHDYYRWRLDYNGSIRYADGRYLTDLFTDEAVGFIERHGKDDNPFFLHLTYNAPHTPLQAPEEEVRPFFDKGTFTPGVSILYGMIHRMDTGAGRVLQALKDTGAAENTIVLFSSDNGPQFGGEGDFKLDRYNCQLHGAKGSVYEGGIRVPGILSWPGGGIGPGSEAGARGKSGTSGGIGGGREIADTVHFCDWLPTLLELAGIEYPGESFQHDALPLDGRSIAPLLRGEKPDQDPVRFWQWTRYQPVPYCNAAMRDGDWKLVHPALQEYLQITYDDIKWLAVSMYGPEHFEQCGILPTLYPGAGAVEFHHNEYEPGKTVGTPQVSREELLKMLPEPELYNIREDPLELTNLADREPQRLKKMQASLEQWFTGVEAERTRHQSEQG